MTKRKSRVGKEAQMNTARNDRLFGNINQGAWGELYGRDILVIGGYEIETRHKGADVHAMKRDLWGNVVEDKLVDFKTGGATLSKKQKECGAEEFHVPVPPFARHFSPPWSK